MFGFRKNIRTFQELPRGVQKELKIITLPGQEPEE